jgi:CHASE2 domain-containing sensor protein
MAPVFRSRHLIPALLVAGVSWALVLALHLFGVFRTADLKIRDWRYLTRGEQAADARIALVMIDDATIAAYGQWPLPRSQYALLIGALYESGARAVGIDLLLFDTIDAADDSVLVLLTRSVDRLAHAMVFPPRDANYSSERKPPESWRALLDREGITAGPLRVWRATDIALPFVELADATSAIGHVTVFVDRDGPVRRVPFLVGYGRQFYPALSLRLAAMATGDGRIRDVRQSPVGLKLTWSDGRSLEFPVDGEGGTAIDFAGDAGSFRNYSMLDVVQWYSSGNDSLLRSNFEGRLVLVGNTAMGAAAADIGTTPFSNRTPLVYVHANALNSLLQGRFLRSPPSWLFFLLSGLAALGLGALVMVRPLLQAAVAVLLALVVWQIVAYVSLAFARYDMPSLLPALLPPLVYLSVGSFRFFYVERLSGERDRELKLARDIQQKLLPQSLPDIPQFDVYGVNMPAQEVGGDYYDWIQKGNGELLVALGDVSGKGVSASLLVSHLRASLHAESRGGGEPQRIITYMHESLYQAVEPGHFATFFLAAAAAGNSHIRYCNAGHNPPLLVRPEALELLEATGPPLGMFDGISYVEAEAHFAPGDCLVLYSDGVTEAPAGGVLYGEERLVSLVEKLVRSGVSARAIGEGILADVSAYTRRSNDWDDVTLVVVRRIG